MTEAKPVAQRSEAAREASRRNGAKSRGPKTAKGKAISARNAIKHGLRARRTLTVDTMPEWVGRIEATYTAALGPLGIRNGEELERLLFTLILIEEAEQHIAAEIGRLRLKMSEGPGSLTPREIELLRKLCVYRKRFHGTRNKCIFKLRP